MRAFTLTFALCAASAAFSQQYRISTLAGGAIPTTPVSALTTSVQPRNVAVDSTGNLYFSSGNAVYKLATNGTITPVAGNSRAGYSGDFGAATQAQLNQPSGIAVDGKGDIFIADTNNNVVRLVTPDGIISTLAGNGVAGYGADGQIATDLDPLAGGILNHPVGLAVDKSGNVYIADTNNHLVRKVDTGGGISTFAGNHVTSAGYSGNGGPSWNAQLTYPTDVAIDGSGNVYIADYGNFVIRKVGTDGLINTIAGNTVNTFAGDNGVPTSASLAQPYAVAVDGSGNVYVTQYGDSRIRKIASGSGGKITTIAGNGSFGFGGDNGAATSAQLSLPHGIAADSSGNLYIADWGNNRIRKVSGSNISTIAGNGLVSFAGDGGPAIYAQLNAPTGVAVDTAGNVYVVDSGNNVVRQINKAGVVTTFAGNGTAGFGGDGSAARSAQLNSPQSVAVDAAGNVYIADAGNYRVRLVNPAGNISTFAGTGTPGYTGDNGAATAATFYYPSAVAVDNSGSVYIADLDVGVVRKVTGGTITTVAGNGNSGTSGDGAIATTAQLNGPIALAVDPNGVLYIAQIGDNLVRKVGTNRVISTVAGNGGAGYSGEGVPAVGSQIFPPNGIAVDGSGNLFITSAGNRIQKVAADGTISTIAGTGDPGYTGDGATATAAKLNVPQGIAIDPAGNLYFADSGNNAVRELTPYLSLPSPGQRNALHPGIGH